MIGLPRQLVKSKKCYKGVSKIYDQFWAEYVPTLKRCQDVLWKMLFKYQFYRIHSCLVLLKSLSSYIMTEYGMYFTCRQFQKVYTVPHIIELIVKNIHKENVLINLQYSYQCSFLYTRIQRIPCNLI